MKTTQLPPTRPLAGSNLESSLNGASNGNELVLVAPSEPSPASGKGKRAEAYTALDPAAIAAALRAQGKATAAQIESILWLHAHGVQLGLGSLSALGQCIGYGGATLSLVFGGKYAGDLGAIARAVEAYRPVWQSRQSLGSDPILPLAPALAIERFANNCRSSATVGMVWGRSHTGKTRGVRRYADLHPDTTVLVTMPVGGSLPAFTKALVAAGRVKVRKGETREDAFCAAMTPQHLLVVDQVHRTILGRRMQMGTIDLLVEIHDRTGMGVLLMATPTFVEAVQDERNSMFFEQLENRGVLRLQLPAELPYEDAVLLGRAYGLPAPDAAASAFLRGLLGKYRLGRLTKYLRLARGAAAVNEQEFSWAHVQMMHETLADWVMGVGVYEDLGAADGKEGK